MTKSITASQKAFHCLVYFTSKTLKRNFHLLYNRNVTAGATGATAVVPNALSLIQPGAEMYITY